MASWALVVMFEPWVKRSLPAVRDDRWVGEFDLFRSCDLDSGSRIAGLLRSPWQL